MAEIDWLDKMQNTLTPARVAHSLGVAETAAELAAYYDEEPEGPAWLASSTIWHARCALPICWRRR